MFERSKTKEEMIEEIKDVKIRKGAILDRKTIEKTKKKVKEMSDDDLLLAIANMFGELIVHCQGNNVMAIYGLAVGYFVLENEALDRELYW